MYRHCIFIDRPLLSFLLLILYDGPGTGGGEEEDTPTE